MAESGRDPFDFSGPDAAVDVGRLKNQWTEFFADPRAQGALLQFGLQMMQPVGVGQNGLGHFAQAVGASGEQLGRAEAIDFARRDQDRKDEDVDTKGILRSAQAETSESRAKAAEANANTAAIRAAALNDRNRLQQEALEARQRMNRTTNLVRAQGIYNRELQKIMERNTNQLRDKNAPLEVVPSFQEWVSKNPSLAVQLGIGADGGTPGGSAGGNSGAPAGEVAAPEAPREPAKRSVGTIYITPRGPLRWKGNGWEQP